jgi:hypothetical protein
MINRMMKSFNNEMYHQLSGKEKRFENVCLTHDMHIRMNSHECNTHTMLPKFPIGKQ